MMIFKKKSNHLKKQETNEEKTKKQEELVEIVKKIRNIDLYGNQNTKIIKEKFSIEKESSKKMSVLKVLKEVNLKEEESIKEQERLTKIFKHIRNIDLTKPKINTIDMINIEKMNDEQLKNTYKFIKKSILECQNKGRKEEMEKLQRLKQKIKKNLLENSDELEKIKITLKTGDFDNIDEYEQYLLKLYNEMNQKKIINFDESERERKIKILTLLKLIKKIKSNNKQYKRKIA